MDFCVQLKICEGCGSLWFRAQGQGVYCRQCEIKLKDFPAPESRKKRGRPSRKAVLPTRAWVTSEAIGGAE